MKKATIYDVARESGLSIKTVSRVMNHDPTVKPGNKDRVLDVAERLAYSPSLFARSLAGARSFVIAAFLDAELTLQQWSEGRPTDYVSRLQLGAMPECREAGYHFTLELIDHDPAKLGREVREVLQTLKPDGVLLTPPSCDDPRVLEILDEAQVRYARLGSVSSRAGGVRLGLGDRSGAASVTRHLIELGHRRIGVVTGPLDQPGSVERLAGFKDVMAAAGFSLDPSLMFAGDFTFASGVRAMRALGDVPFPPSAIVACNDEMALGCLSVLPELGLECPRTISIAGFDDSVGARFSQPQLTTVRQPLVEMTREAVRRLIKWDQHSEELVRAPATLIINSSTGPLTD